MGDLIARGLSKGNSNKIGDLTNLPTWLQVNLTDAVSKLNSNIEQHGLNVRQPPYNAKGDGTTDDSVAINQAIQDAKAKKIGRVFFPRPSVSYKIKNKILNDGRVSLIGDITGSTTLDFSVTNDWGIDISGAGLGGSSTDTITIANFNIWGNAKALIRSYGTGLHRISNLVFQNGSSCGLYIDSCQDFKISDIDMLNIGNPSTDKEGACLYIKNSNNVYFSLFRVESPKTYAIYADGYENSNIKFITGKVDGNANTPSTNPFIVADNCELEFKDFGCLGAKSYPLEIKQAGKLKLKDFKFARITANAIVKADNISYFQKPIASGYMPGVIMSPKVTFNDCYIMAESDNSATVSVKSLVYTKAPDINQKPDGTDMIEVTNGNTNGNNQMQFTLKYWNGSAYTVPSSNDKYVGSYLTHKQTGKRNRITYNISDGTARAEDPKTADFPNGQYYRTEFARENGLLISAKDLVVDYRTSRSVFTKFFKQTSVTVNSSTWDVANWRTVVELSAAQTDNQFKGMYLYNATNSKYYLIRDNIGTQIFLEYDVSAEVTSGAYEVRAGKEIETFDFKYDE
ncbi:glycosyl hydrolase family 28-related protein [Priestia megaterium]